MFLAATFPSIQSVLGQELG